MKTQNPSATLGLPNLQLQWAQSLHKAINGGLEEAYPTGKDSTGNYNTFDQGNNNSQLVRVGASGATDNDYAWSTSSTPIVINHSLGRQPIGAHVVNSDKNLTVWIPSTPTSTTISIAPSDATANATIKIF